MGNIYTRVMIKDINLNSKMSSLIIPMNKTLFAMRKGTMCYSMYKLTRNKVQQELVFSKGVDLLLFVDWILLAKKSLQMQYKFNNQRFSMSSNPGCTARRRDR